LILLKYDISEFKSEKVVNTELKSEIKQFWGLSNNSGSARCSIFIMKDAKEIQRI